MVRGFTRIEYCDVFSTPDFQKKLKFYAGRENGRFVMGVSTSVAEVIEVIGDTLLTGTTMDEEFVIIPGANPEDDGAMEFNPVINPMLMTKFVPWRNPVVSEFLDQRLKTDGLWEFQGYWDPDFECLVFSLKGGKEVE